ncbi:MAG: hypothetical protein M1825_000645 [Sarcosagium campestre]|nr:MAG: hypothetical protein M1825_000645 [Sarcosagium campestre]
MPSPNSDPLLARLRALKAATPPIPSEATGATRKAPTTPPPDDPLLTRFRALNPQRSTASKSLTSNGASLESDLVASESAAPSEEEVGRLLAEAQTCLTSADTETPSGRVVKLGPVPSPKGARFRIEQPDNDEGIDAEADEYVAGVLDSITLSTASRSPKTSAFPLPSPSSSPSPSRSTISPSETVAASCPAFPTAPTHAPRPHEKPRGQKGKASHSKADFSDQEIDGWCAICCDDAVLLCRGCAGERYCIRCWEEGHEGEGSAGRGGHGWVLLKDKKP